MRLLAWLIKFMLFVTVYPFVLVISCCVGKKK